MRRFADCLSSNPVVPLLCRCHTGPDSAGEVLRHTPGTERPRRGFHGGPQDRHSRLRAGGTLHRLTDAGAWARARGRQRVPSADDRLGQRRQRHWNPAGCRPGAPQPGGDRWGALRPSRNRPAGRRRFDLQRRRRRWLRRGRRPGSRGLDGLGDAAATHGDLSAHHRRGAGVAGHQLVHRASGGAIGADGGRSAGGDDRPAGLASRWSWQVVAHGLRAVHHGPEPCGRRHPRRGRSPSPIQVLRAQRQHRVCHARNPGTHVVVVQSARRLPSAVG